MREQLLADLRAICQPFDFDPTMRGILKSCDNGLTSAAIAVNVAMRERLIASRTLRMAIRAWAAEVNAAGGP